MTREEAIKRLKEIDIRDALQDDYDALHIAIKALEQEDMLDKIRADLMMMECMEDAIEIIDEYRK